MSGAPDYDTDKSPDAAVEVTPEMIEAGAAILWDDPFLHHPASFGHCEDLAEKVIRGALEARSNKNSLLRQRGQ